MTSCRSRSSRSAWKRASSPTAIRPRSSSASSRMRSTSTRTWPASQPPSSSCAEVLGVDLAGGGRSGRRLGGESLARRPAGPIPGGLRRLGEPARRRSADDADPSGKALVPPLELRTVRRPGRRAPDGRACSRSSGPLSSMSTRRPPARSGPRHDVDADLAVTPALVDLPAGADARHFLEAQGLGWTYDLAARRGRGDGHQDPHRGAPRPADERGTTGSSWSASRSGKDHGAAVASLLDAHRYTRGLDLLPPGTATNVTDEAPEAAGRLDVQALFDSEFDRPVVPPPKKPPARTLPPVAASCARRRPAPSRSRSDSRRHGPRSRRRRGRPRARALARGEPGALAGDLGHVVLRPDELGERRLAAAAPRRHQLPPRLVHRLRPRGGPAPHAPGGASPLRDPPGLDVRASRRQRRPRPPREHADRHLRAGRDPDSVPLLDPDASDVAPDEDAEEQASDVGAIYGATPHIRELRLRPVDDTLSGAERPLLAARRPGRADVRSRPDDGTGPSRPRRSSRRTPGTRPSSSGRTTSGGGRRRPARSRRGATWRTTSTRCPATPTRRRQRSRSGPSSTASWPRTRGC